jgi:UDP-N-acetylmuramyl-tripeptide synthetase
MNDLIKLLEHHPEIKSVTSHSKEVRPGSVFVAVSGEKVDGTLLIEEALQSGASWVVSEKKLNVSRSTQVKDARAALGFLASQLAGNPSDSMIVLGVTGTSGKTTTTYLLENILKADQHKVGVIGTIHIRIGDQVLPATHTTPGAVELQSTFLTMKHAGCTAVVMEVSSHALKQHRAYGVAFDGVIFTNLSPEHLDYHPDLEDYYQSKKLLFTDQARRSSARGKKIVAAIHDDQKYGSRLFKELNSISDSPFLKIKAFCVDDSVMLDESGIHGVFSGISISSPLLARFNAENIASAVCLSQAMGIGESAIQAGINTLLAVPGRLERVLDPKLGRVILVDYAHKPDALEKVLLTLKELKKPTQKIITVMGCGGDRDRTKRPKMGEIGMRLSDILIVTSDNPRSENPQSIIEEITAPLPHGAYRVEPDRKKAIETAIALAHSGDWVMIAGKGHEDYQIIGNQKIPFDDRKIAANAMGYDI